ncbi:MAG: alpha/beta fold hydrolase [Leptolyngbya sp. SIO4C1]|nr:alpha/beta fold hydrolase [Leptolyngbya sp. SIO4C1]
MQLWCLHGNLQTPAVWASLRSQLTLPLEIVAIDLWQTLAPSCAAWAQQFNRTVAAQAAGDRVLLGYSLGGRLALQALVLQPRLWNGAIIIAADPGVADAAERAACRQHDRAWGQRFLTEPWAEVLAAWDSQPVFAGRPNPQPRSQLSRSRVCQAFENYSKGRQADLRPALAQLRQPPILYVTGSADVKYSTIGAELTKTCSVIEHAAIPQAAHRVPWEAPLAFTELITQFLCNCYGFPKKKA